MKKIFLLADDDGDDRHLFAEALEAVDPSFVCYVVTNGIEVLDILSSEVSPDLIFLDINMPRMNGWQCLKTIKETEAFKHIPVFMYSTSSHQRDMDIALDLGAHCFVTKPHSFNELKKILKVVVENMHRSNFDALVHFQNVRVKKLPPAAQGQ
jgi:CheY-like chemotaxis protein